MKNMYHNSKAYTHFRNAQGTHSMVKINVIYSFTFVIFNVSWRKNVLMEHNLQRLRPKYVIYVNVVRARYTF